MRSALADSSEALKPRAALPAPRAEAAGWILVGRSHQYRAGFRQRRADCSILTVAYAAASLVEEAAALPELAGPGAGHG